MDDRDVEDPELLIKLLELVDDILRASSLDLSVHCLNLLGRKRDCVPANPVLPSRRPIRLVEEKRNLTLFESDRRPLCRVECLHPEQAAVEPRSPLLTVRLTAEFHYQSNEDRILYRSLGT